MWWACTSATTATSFGSSFAVVLRVITSNVWLSSANRKSAGPGCCSPPCGIWLLIGSELMKASFGRSRREAEAMSFEMSNSRNRSREGSSIGRTFTVSACWAVSPR